MGVHFPQIIVIWYKMSQSSYKTVFKYFNYHYFYYDYFNDNYLQYFWIHIKLIFVLHYFNCTHVQSSSPSWSSTNWERIIAASNHFVVSIEVLTRRYASPDDRGYGCFGTKLNDSLHYSWYMLQGMLLYYIMFYNII